MFAAFATVLVAAQLSAPAVVAPDWAAEQRAPLVSQAAIRSAVRAVLEEERAAEAAYAPKHASDTLRGDAYQRFAADFAEARVPNCLHADGLKRQSTLIFSGVLALPFVAIAKLRGKCN
jgi:hypothetical protein